MKTEVETRLMLPQTKEHQRLPETSSEKGKKELSPRPFRENTTLLTP